MPPRRINEIVLGKRGITPDTALGLADALCHSEYYWMALQIDYDLERARERFRKRGGRFEPWRMISPWEY